MVATLMNLYWQNINLDIRLALKGIGYWRTIEYPLVLMRLSPSAGERILDIGSSNSPLPFYLANFGCEVYAIDIDPKVLRQRYYSRRLKRGSIIPKVMDATNLDFPTNYFDKISIVSTLEHILGHGDSIVMKQVSRVLKPNGVLFVSVPFSSNFLEYYSDDPQGKDRWYDWKELNERIIEPSMQKTLSIDLFEERIFQFAKIWLKLPLFIRIPFLWMQPILSKLFLKKSQNKSSRYLSLACITLRKEMN